jgi:hypothetical protein
MNKSLLKSRLFALIALGILTFWFVIPAVLTHNVKELVDTDKTELITPLTVKVWNFYQKGRYLSPNAPNEVKGAYKKDGTIDLDAMIKADAEISVATAPIWYVALEAPNYPKEAFPEGIPVFYHFDGFSGDVHEMNTINHFIGMDPMKRGAPYLRMLAPYALIFVALLFVFFILYNNKLINFLMIIPIVLPLIFLGFYSYWLYWFGHHMHDWGAFKIKPFTPTIFGDGKVAQFITHSYPTWGFWLLVAISVLSLLALVSRIKANKQEA